MTARETRSTRFSMAVACTLIVVLLVSLSACSREAKKGSASSPATHSSSHPKPSASAQPSPSASTGAAQTHPLGSYYQVFADPTLAQCLAEIIGDKPQDQLTQETVDQVGFLMAVGIRKDLPPSDRDYPHCGKALLGLQNLSGMEVFTHLQTLYLDNLPAVSDLTPLKGLTNLLTIRLNGTAVKDYSPLNHSGHEWLQVYINPDQPSPSVSQQQSLHISVRTQDFITQDFIQ